mmetsp:Transcript_97233/g.302752  ORF Transcript_97233/g.302752 Transcript_97233/m.302752 type:complete len:267 (+) Transcript_97233:266-1066(+)
MQRARHVCHVALGHARREGGPACGPAALRLRLANRQAVPRGLCLLGCPAILAHNLRVGVVGEAPKDRGVAVLVRCARDDGAEPTADDVEYHLGAGERHLAIGECGRERPVVMVHPQRVGAARLPDEAEIVALPVQFNAALVRVVRRGEAIAVLSREVLVAAPLHVEDAVCGDLPAHVRGVLVDGHGRLADAEHLTGDAKPAAQSDDVVELVVDGPIGGRLAIVPLEEEGPRAAPVLPPRLLHKVVLLVERGADVQPRHEGQNAVFG